MYVHVCCFVGKWIADEDPSSLFKFTKYPNHKQVSSRAILYNGIVVTCIHVPPLPSAHTHPIQHSGYLE